MLTHITDVGAPAGNGVDSTLRIEGQYMAMGQMARVISAGFSPLHVVFAASAILSPQATEVAEAIRESLGGESASVLPMALNSAPRNASVSQPDGKEGVIYRLKFASGATYLVYGSQVVGWMLDFCGRGATVEQVLSVGDLIPDTSKGSQFRSAEHLPVVHTLEAAGRLDAMATIEPLDIESFATHLTGVVVAPSDEYGNGRLIMTKAVAEEILAAVEIKLPELTAESIIVRTSLTEVVPGELSVWPSSNHVPNHDVVVLNLGTRWQPGTTRTTDEAVLKLQPILEEKTGHVVALEK